MKIDNDEKFWMFIVNVVDSYRRNNSGLNLNEVFFELKEYSAYYAGLVEFLSHEKGVKPPNWVYRKRFYLKNPYFPGNFKSYGYRILTMIESPVEFKTRNIFIGSNTFDRC